MLSCAVRTNGNSFMHAVRRRRELPPADPTPSAPASSRSSSQSRPGQDPHVGSGMRTPAASLTRRNVSCDGRVTRPVAVDLPPSSLQASRVDTEPRPLPVPVGQWVLFSRLGNPPFHSLHHIKYVKRHMFGILHVDEIKN
jgi:hypothetical protein